VNSEHLVILLIAHHLDQPFSRADDLRLGENRERELPDLDIVAPLARLCFG
jgi:hypothetical protein